MSPVELLDVSTILYCINVSLHMRSNGLQFANDLKIAWSRGMQTC